MTYAPVDERIGHWNIVEKQYIRVEYVVVKITKLLFVSYNSICSMCCGWWHFCYHSLLAFLRKEIGKPRKEIGNLNGFEYRYLNDLKVTYF
jgi:hypothetical protein